MSIQAVAWVLDQSEATYADRLVLIAIANHVGASGWAWPAIPSIAREARLGRATVFRAIEALEEAGELTIQRRPGKPNLYGLSALIGGSQIETGHPEVKGSQSGTGGVSSARRVGSQSGTRIIKNHQEPSRGRAREATDTSPILATTTMPPLPPELPDDVKARGVEYFRALRKGPA